MKHDGPTYPGPFASVGSAVLLAAVSLLAGFVQETPPRDAVVSGKWAAWVGMTVVGSRENRALFYRQQVYRQGEGEAKPVFLCEEVSTGRFRLFLRDDGLLLVQPVAGMPRIYFTGSMEPVELELPAPKEWKHLSPPSDEIGSCWFLGDILFYGRYAEPGRYLIGFAKIDSEGKRILENRLCVEVTGHEQEVARAAEISGSPLSVGDCVMWVNGGYDSTYFPDRVQGTWALRKVRGVSLKTASLLSDDEVPLESLRAHKQDLMRFLERCAGGDRPYAEHLLETWAVSTMGKVGEAEDAARLAKFAETVKGKGEENGRLRTAYRSALKALRKE